MDSTFDLTREGLDVSDSVTVRVLRFPSLGAESELDALAAEEGVDLRWIDRPEDLGAPDVVVLPGSEATLADLAWMRSTGLERAVREAALAGSTIFGICGGFQIMGRELRDPERIEGGADRAEGMGVFATTTTFTRAVIDEPSRGTGRGGLVPEGVAVTGFELHGGRTVLDDATGVVSLFEEETKGGAACPLAVATADLAAVGTYLHGILADPAFRRPFLDHVRLRRRARR